MDSSEINSLIKTATVGDVVDLKVICQALNIALKIDNELGDLCKIGVGANDKVTIWLNAKLDKKTKFTLVAIAIAEYIIHPNRVGGQGVIYDMFFLKELNSKKRSKLIMLATRLVIPEHIIEKLSDALDNQFSNDKINDPFDADSYIANAGYLPEFIRCIIKESTSMFLLDNLPTN